MKVLYLDQSGQLGGGEIALLPWLCLKRDDALVVLLEDGPFRERLEHEGVPVQVVSMAGLKQVRRESGWSSTLSSLPALLKTRAELRRTSRNFDVLYANSMKALIVAALIKRWRQPIVWHLRDIISAEHFSAPLRFVVVTIANWFASAIIANSKATANAFVSAGGNRKRITVVYDGVSATNFDEPDLACVQMLRQSFAPRERLLLGVFSRLSPWKGQHIVLDAISTIPNVDLLVVGDALFGESEYAASLSERAAQADLSGRVTFLGFRSDVAELMRCIDIVIHSSTSAEPFGLVIVEGMLAAKPVIATNAGGATEIVQSDRTGVLVTPGSVTELRDAILRLSKDAALRNRLGTLARLHATKTFTLAAMFAGISGVMDRLKSYKRRQPFQEGTESDPAHPTPAGSGLQPDAR